MLAHGTGALNIDGCRVGDDGGTRDKPVGIGQRTNKVFGTYGACVTESINSGRWPANIIFDEDAAAELEQARYFYCAKASKKERNAGLAGSTCIHPTVKPIALMRYLIRLVTPPGGTVLDPFLGSGTTAVAATLEGFEWLGCELTPEYWPIIQARTKWAKKKAAKPQQGKLANT